MGNQRDDRLAATGLPDLLTVEEAALLLRVGRTKAYALTREWRATGGRSGLPVVDLGDVLRVPRQALERMLGVELTGPLPAGKARGVADAAALALGLAQSAPGNEPVPHQLPSAIPASNVTPMRRAGRRQDADQSTLFEASSTEAGKP